MGSEARKFFDPSRARGGRTGPDIGADADAPSGGDPPGGTPEPQPAGAAPWSVSTLVRRIKGALDDAFPAPVAVLGEISNFKRHSSGHLYFRLKDADAAIDAVMFRSAARRLKFEPENGLEVVADGRVDVYDVRGQLQLYVERMTPRGAGALELAFRQLREKLEREGLFDPSRKRPIPAYPRAIGVVTSRTGAAIRDIRRTLRARWPAARVYLLPALVQGEGAAEQIAAALGALDTAAARLEIDTIIVARGGGSLEDLWAFNEEPVARAVAAARTPVVSGVGHEVDVTICDLVADARAATPTAAAQLAAPDAVEVRRHVEQLAVRMARGLRDDVGLARQTLDGVLRSAVFRDPTARVHTRMQQVDELSRRLRSASLERLARDFRRLEPACRRIEALHPARLAERARARLAKATGGLRWALGERNARAAARLAALDTRLAGVHPTGRLRLARQRVTAARRQLEALSYRSVLRRGFSVTRRADGDLVRSVEQVRPGERIETELADGRVRSTVDSGDLAGPPANRPTRRRRASRPRPADEQPGLFDTPGEET